VATAGTLVQDERRFDRLGWLNVKDYGAIGNGTANDRAAIQAAIDDVPASGGIVYLPPGHYRVGTPGLKLPNNKCIELRGVGPQVGNSGTQPVVEVSRTGAGTFDLIYNDQSTASEAVRFCGAIRNIQFYNGDGYGGRLALFKSTNHALWECVEFRGDPATPNSGTEFRGIWNSNIRNCKWHRLGNQMTPAMFVSSDGNMGGNSNTVHWEGCEWEVNSGVDIYLDSATVNCALCFFTNCKLEHNSDLGATRTYPLVYLARAQSSAFSACGFFLSNASASLIQIPSGGASERNSFVGCIFEHGGAPSGTFYLVEQQRGSLSVTGSVFSNYRPSLTSAWRIGSSVSANGAQGAGNIYYDTTASKRYSDARSGGGGPTSMP
jgi:hypothetical protein